MEQCSFLDYICQNIQRISQDSYIMMGISEYTKLLVSYNLGVISTEQLADGSVMIIRSIRSRESGQMLYESYIKLTN